jgi:hypothetical protein
VSFQKPVLADLYKSLSSLLRKINIRLHFRLIKHHAMKMCVEVEA